MLLLAFQSRRDLDMSEEGKSILCLNQVPYGQADVRNSIKYSEMCFCFSEAKLLNYLKFVPDVLLLILFYFLYPVWP